MCTAVYLIHWAWSAINRCRCILPADTLVPERYGRDGTIAYLKGEEGSFYRILPATFEEEWLAPRSYLKQLPDSTVFNHVILSTAWIRILLPWNMSQKVSGRYAA